MEIARRPPDQGFDPVPTPFTAPFWEAARQRRLVAAQCADCGRFRMPPTPFCPQCQSQRLDWPDLPGTGTLYSYTVVNRALVPGTEGSIPYVPAVIEPDGAAGIRLVSNLVDIRIDLIVIGLRLAVVWDEHPSGYVLPRFRPA
jgi:uncharacterized OB-fold protein